MLPSSDDIDCGDWLLYVVSRILPGASLIYPRILFGIKIESPRAGCGRGVVHGRVSFVGLIILWSLS
jgi:hypothetical protein